MYGAQTLNHERGIARAMRRARNPSPSPRPAWNSISLDTELLSRANRPSDAEEKIAKPKRTITTTSTTKTRSPEINFIPLEIGRGRAVNTAVKPYPVIANKRTHITYCTRASAISNGIHGYFKRATVIPRMAQTTPIIQYRIVTLYEGQPIASKWWCRGAIRNTFFPRNLLEATWITFEKTVTTSGNAMIGSAATPYPSPGVSVIKAMTASVSVRPMVPVSVIQKRAGGILNQRKASIAPASVAENAARLIWFWKYAMPA